MPFGGGAFFTTIFWEDFSTGNIDHIQVLMIEWFLVSIGPPFLTTCISENPHRKTEPEAIGTFLVVEMN